MHRKSDRNLNFPPSPRPSRSSRAKYNTGKSFFLRLLGLSAGILVLALATLGGLAMVQPNQEERGLPRRGFGGLELQDGLPRSFAGPSRFHKLLLDEEESAVYEQLRSLGAVRREVNYGSFRMVVIDEQAIGGRAELERLPVAIRDDQNLINLNGYILDTLDPDELYERIPADLRSRTQGGFAPEGALGVSRAGALHIVQFVGPVQDAWLEDLRMTGVELVSYLPSNAFVVYAGEPALSELRWLETTSGFVQFVGTYAPAFRLSPRLELLRKSRSPVEVVVQVVDHPEVESAVAVIESLALGPVRENRVLEYRNLHLQVEASRLTEIAHLDGVFAVEEDLPRRLLDEAQGQIVAGNLSGGSPTGPGYLNWLNGRGFTSSQFTSFSVNVVDDAYSLSGHPDLPGSRIAFQLNPTNQSGTQGGHGFLNAHIVGGFNNGSGSGVEDSLGFNYGLGIAPFARVGVTAIFGSGGASSTSWENQAYQQGARISTNSWGYDIQRYNVYAQEYDRIVRDSRLNVSGLQQMTIVFAAGNDGPTTNTIGSPATAKNVIAVGAGENVRATGSDGCGVPNSSANSAHDVVGFSSRGPVNPNGGDGRIKPDLIAPGTHIQAGVPQSSYDGSSVCNKYWPSGQTLYGWSSGTSHSCPAVAGGAALVYQHFLNRGIPAPSPAMVKAFLMNSAAYMTGNGAADTLPSNNQGMGRMDLGRAFDAADRVLIDQSDLLGSTGQVVQVDGTVISGSRPFRVTLAWTDAPGPTSGAPWVNNLDLIVNIGGKTYRGNVFSGALSVAGGTADVKNNVESVFLPAGTSGAFTVTVRAANIAGDGVPGNGDTTDQDFALVIYNGTRSDAPAGAILDFSPASLAFSATAGGANPGAKSLSISNLSGGGLAWQASESAAWLTLSPTSGAGSATISVSVDISGLSAGVYNADIILSADEASNSPASVPVKLTVTDPTSAEEGERVVNGGFEVKLAPWKRSGQAKYKAAGKFPHSGTGYVQLGMTDYATGAVFQAITIPSNATSANLTFWLSVTTKEQPTSYAYDRMFVEVRNTSGKLLKTLAVFSNLNKGKAGVYTQKGAFDLLQFRGKKVRIQFRVKNDFLWPTTFFVDDVSVR